jgi:hypothetical protein
MSRTIITTGVARGCRSADTPVLAMVSRISHRADRGDGVIIVFPTDRALPLIGKFDSAAQPVKVGDIGIFNGRRTTFWGRPQLRVHSVQWLRLPRNNQWRQAALTVGISLTLYRRLNKLGKRWPVLLLRYPWLLSQRPLSFFRKKTRQHLLGNLPALFVARES